MSTCRVAEKLISMQHLMTEQLGLDKVGPSSTQVLAMENKAVQRESVAQTAISSNQLPNMLFDADANADANAEECARSEANQLSGARSARQLRSRQGRETWRELNPTPQ